MEDFVKYETAKLAEEKGFDKECSHYYDIIHKELDKHSQNKWCNSEIKNGLGKFKFPMIAAPTQSELQKYLRNVHNIHVTVNFHSHPKLEKDWYEMWISSPHNDFRGHGLFLMKKIEAMGKKINWLDSPEEFGMFSSHEEALEAGIFYSLNLIQC